VLPISLQSFGDIVNKAFGVGMINGVAACSLTFRAELRAGVTTPALASSARASAMISSIWTSVKPQGRR
jgi:hypothetical protein